MSGQQTASRGIAKVWDVETRPAGGSHLRVGQVLPPGNWTEYDPFLMMAEDWFQQGTFGFHPHRGIETVTYVIEGKLKHENNHGGRGILGPGDVQWMTAGRGLIHSEDPLPGETVHSLQLWVNLPAEEKMTEPRYQDLSSADIPVREESGARVRVFSGTSGPVSASTRNVVPVTYLEIEMEAGATLAQQLPADYNGFLYILEGTGRFGSDQTAGKPHQVLWMGPAHGGAAVSEIVMTADHPLRLLLIAGRPLREPVVAYGPFVMNTKEQIQQAFQDYQSGKFGKV
ncbi:pirin family protein [Cohnella pontilimi]|uniref:Pirin family protein n=1 Tax=Cohnella pontilimi TaxID=2564100 RepID=A0A4U0FAK9_9BACL|nr:pirin family protein [Cohnella pontilimi]TJY41833.1 pirin family protein [Cohnella pontilimi]